ncbi:CGNR zinc finger domain-containing protein [Anaeromyxobacter terrae]|uniref:CGNR zinc finger domain-containing protein n=1 Tax=Anaeromyxobacter terrae TaxID=2925406 RepID=UPI001F573158|nr:ABATE domain-containing protein [Anaeromyxobacter sp. SG22]
MATTDMTPSREFDLSGGRLCLDFANTVSMRDVKPRERLAAYADLVAFARATGAVDEPLARRLLGEARRRPADADDVLRQAIALREALFRIFLARAEGQEPAPADEALLSAALSTALAHRRLARHGEGYALGWDDTTAALDAPLWPIVESAAALLTSGELERVRVCSLHESQECSWLFLDQTRARTRRWCSMKDCGNVAKARRHHARAKEAGDG